MIVVQIGGFLTGAQKTIELGIHDYLCKNNHKSYVFYEYGHSTDFNVYCYETKIENILTRGLRKVIGKYPIFTRLQTKRLVQKLRMIKPDIIHLHILHDGCVDYCYLLKYIAKSHIPVVYTMHDLWALTGGCYHYTQSKCIGYLNQCVDCMGQETKMDCKKKRAQKEYLMKKKLLLSISKYASVGVSYWVKGEIMKSYLSRRPVYVIHNCIDDFQNDILQKYVVPLRKTRYRLIGVSQTWDETKGINEMFELARGLGTDYEVLLVGKINKQYFDSEVPDNVSFYGYCEDKYQLYCLLAEADVNISMSVEETFGMTFVEAAAVGTRSIGYASTGIDEVLKMTYGISVSKQNIDFMIKEVKRLVLEDKMKLSSEQIARIKQYFSIERMAKEYCEVYNSINVYP